MTDDGMKAVLYL